MFLVWFMTENSTWNFYILKMFRIHLILLLWVECQSCLNTLINTCYLLVGVLYMVLGSVVTIKLLLNLTNLFGHSQRVADSLFIFCLRVASLAVKIKNKNKKATSRTTKLPLEIKHTSTKVLLSECASKIFFDLKMFMIHLFFLL